MVSSRWLAWRHRYQRPTEPTKCNGLLSRSWRGFFLPSLSLALFSLLSHASWVAHLCSKWRECLSLQMEWAPFDDPICILLLCCFYWPENERYRQAAALSGQQATLGFCLYTLLACPPTKCLLEPFNPFPEMNWPDVAQLIPLARQKILARCSSLLRSQVWGHQQREVFEAWFAPRA